MLHSNHEFPHSGDIPGLTPSEKEEGWQNVQAFMEEERAAASLFEGVEAIALTSEEKSAGWSAVQNHMSEEKEVAAFLAEARSESLSSPEKRKIWAMIAPSVQERAPEASALPWYERVVDACNVFFRFGWAAPALGIVFIATSVGASYASADSLPGEFMYSVKKVGEQLRSGLHLSTESRAEGEARRMSNRVHEVELLKKREQLTDEVRVSLDQEYKLERRRAIQHIQELELAGNQEVSSRLRARLNALEDHYESLVNGESREEPTNPKRHEFPTVIEDKVEEILEDVNDGASAIDGSSSIQTESSVSVRASRRRNSEESSSKDEDSVDSGVRVNVEQNVKVSNTSESSNEDSSEEASEILGDIDEQVKGALKGSTEWKLDL